MLEVSRFDEEVIGEGADESRKRGKRDRHVEPAQKKVNERIGYAGQDHGHQGQREQWVGAE